MSERGYTRKLFDVLRSPRTTFETVTEKDFKKGLTVVIVIALLASASRYLYVQKTPITIPDDIPTGPGGPIDATGLRQMMMNLASITEFIRYLVELMLLAVLVFTAGKTSTGEGSLKRFMAQTGLVYTPLLIQQLLRIVYAATMSTVAYQGLSISATQPILIRIFDTSLEVFSLFGIATFIFMAILVNTDFKLEGKKALIYTLLAYAILILLKTFTFL